LSSTVRALGLPPAEAVATTIAFGSGSPASSASSNQRVNCVIGSAATSVSSNGLPS
jgi:hypothetical protein